MQHKHRAIVILFIAIFIIIISLILFIFFGNSSDTNSTKWGWLPWSHNTIFQPETGPNPPTPDKPTTSNENESPKSSFEIFWQLHNKPVAGALATHYNGKKVAIFIEKNEGQIFISQIETQQKTKLKNLSAPGIQEIVWLKNNQIIYRRFDDLWDTIKSYKSNWNDTIQNTTPLLNNIIFITKSDGDYNTIYYTKKIGNGLGIYQLKDTSKLLSKLDFTEFLPQQTKQGLYLTTLPSNGLPGYTFLYNPDNGNMEKILNDKRGLTILPSPDGKQILYTTIDDDAIQSYILNLGTNTSEITLKKPVLPEKCIWEKNNSYKLWCSVPTNINQENLPDSWYKGITHFTDKLFKIDTKTGQYYQYLDYSQHNAPNFDGYKLSITDDSSHLVIINKTDQTPWVYNINPLKKIKNGV